MFFHLPHILVQQQCNLRKVHIIRGLFGEGEQELRCISKLLSYINQEDNQGENDLKLDFIFMI